MMICAPYRYLKNGHFFNSRAVRWHRRLSPTCMVWCLNAEEEGSLYAKLHWTTIIQYMAHTGKLMLDHGGWAGPLTRKWMNRILWEYFPSVVRERGLRVYIKNFEMYWEIDGKAQRFDGRVLIDIENKIDSKCRMG